MDDHTLRVLEFDKVRTVVLGFCCSALGRAKVEQMKPSHDPETIRMWLEETAQMRRLLTVRERLPFAGFRDISHALEQMHRQGSPAEAHIFREIYSVLVAAHEFIRLFDSLESAHYPRLQALGEQLYDQTDLVERIDRIVDPRNTIRSEASESLARIRNEIVGHESKIRQRVDRLLQNKTIRRALQDNRFALRNGRCVLPVRTEYKGTVEGILHDASHSGSTVYIEPRELVPLGNALSELMREQEKEEARLLWELTLLVLDQEKRIVHNLDRLAQIEWTYAKATYADHYRMVEPEMTESRALSIVKGCHPLLLNMGSDTVPLTVRAGDDFDTLVVTGPNTGGKTVAVKTVGLIALMAHCGLHVPAAQPTVIPFLNHLFADIGDEQSIEQSLSTFSAHVARIIQILNAADERTLVLMDEFGSGTDPAEGAALAEAILDELATRHAVTIVTTHIGDLKQYAYARPRAENASMEFDVASLRPTYRLSVGQPGASNAITISERLGIDPALAQRARELLGSEGNEATDLILQMQDARSAIEHDREATAAARKEVTRLKRSQEKLVKEAKIREKMLNREAERSIDETFLRALQGVEPILKKLKAGPPAVAQEAHRLDAALREGFAATPLAQQRTEFIRALHKNDYVFIPRLGKPMRVVRVDKKKKRLLLTANNLPMEVSFDDVSAIPPGQ